jgi:hypothetical protein
MEVGFDGCCGGRYSDWALSRVSSSKSDLIERQQQPKSANVSHRPRLLEDQDRGAFFPLFLKRFELPFPADKFTSFNVRR